MIIMWLLLILLHIGSISCQNQPIPDYAVYNLSLKNFVYRFYFPLDKKVFVDPQDGNVDNLQLDWLSGDESPVPITSWVQFISDTKQLFGYLTPAIYENYPKPDGYKYVLKATDKDGNSNTKIYYMKLIDPPPTSPFYIQTLKLTSSDSTIFEMNDAKVLFTLQEDTLFKYNIDNQQGLPNVDDIITESLDITRTNGLSTINLSWSSKLFIANDCPIANIIKFRKPIINKNLDKYKSVFQPKVTVTEFSESLQGKCSSFSLAFPDIGTVSWDSISVGLGVYFSFDVPSNLFISPGGSSMNLRLELRTSNGMAVSSSSWIDLKGSNLQDGYKLEGYATYNIAAQQQAYQYNIVAVTPFEMEASRSFAINIINFQTTQLPWTITFTSSSQVVSTLTFIESFVSKISTFLSTSATNIFVINFMSTESSFKMQWTVKGSLTASQIQIYADKLVTADGAAVSSLTTLMSDIGFSQVSVQLENQDNGGPKPNEQFYTLSIKNFVYRFYFALDKKTFVDPQDGDITNLKLEWLTSDSNPVSSTNWIQLYQKTQQFIGFLSPEIYQNYPKPDGYKYILKATDKDGNSNIKTYFVKLIDPLPTSSYYIQTLSLTSSSSSLYAMNDAEILFTIQETKLFKYNTDNQQGIPLVDNIMTESLRVTRSNGALNIQLSWGSSVFIRDTCPFEQIINFRKHIINENKAKYEAMFQPEFTVQDISETLQGRCSSYSLLSPIIGSVSWESISAGFGIFFSFDIPTNLFSVPTGSSMNLRLELRTSSGLAVTSSNWINLKGSNLQDGYKLEGYATYNVAAQQQAYQYNIVAVTPFGMESSRSIAINILNFQSMNYIWSVNFASIGKLEVSSLTFIENFVNKIATYLSLPATSIIIISFDASGSVFKMQWTVRGSLTAGQIQIYTNKMVTAQGVASSSFKTLMSGIGFNLDSVQFVNNDNGGPRPDMDFYTISIRNFVYRFYFPLDKNTFVDKEDGDITNLQLDWLTSSGDAIAITNWIQLYKKSQQLIGYLSPEVYQNYPTPDGYKYLLKATDKDGNSNTKTYFVKLVEAQPTSSFYIQMLTLTSYSSVMLAMNDAEILFTLQETILFKYNTDNQQGLPKVDNIMTESFKVTRTNGALTILYAWGSSTFIASQCPIGQIVSFRKPIINAKLVNYKAEFSPDFLFITMTEKLQGECSAFSLLSPVIGTISWQSLDIKVGEFFSFDIPSTLFSSPIGSSMNLRLELRTTNNMKVQSSSWVNVKGLNLQDGYKIEGYVPYSAALKQINYNFFIAAISPFEMESSRAFSINIPSFTKQEYDWRTTFTSDRNLDVSQSVFYKNFITEIAKLLGIQPERILIFDSSFNGGKYNIEWTVKDSVTTDQIKSYNEKLMNANGSPTAALQNSMTNIGFQLSSVQVTDENKNKPQPDTSIYTLSIRNFVYRFYFPLDKKTFVDAQDGDITNLKLDWLTSSGNTVASTNWIQLYQKSQQLIGYLSSEVYQNYPTTDGYKYLLKATDKDGNSNTKIYYIKLVDPQPIPPTYLQSLTLSSMSTSFYKQNDAEILFYIQETKLFPYNQNNNQGILDISTIITHSLKVEKLNSKTTVYLTWSSAILIDSSCPISKINTFRLPIMNENRQKYISYFNSEFNVDSFTESLQGGCSKYSLLSPNIELPTWNALTVSFGYPFTMVVPPGLFTLPVGTEMTLIFRLRNSDNTIVEANSWIELTGDNLANLKIEGYPTYDVASKQTSNTFQLVATTPFSMSTSHSLNINIINFKKFGSQFWNVSFRVRNFSMNFTVWITQFLETLSNFLSISKLQIAIIKFEQLDGFYVLQWTLRDVLDTSCEQLKEYEAKIKTGDVIDNSFKIAMNNIGFTINDVIFENSGSCEKLVIQRPLGIIPFYYKTFFNYPIPADTYLDPKGHMLSYSIESNNPFAVTNWLYVIPESKAITGVPIANRLKIGENYAFDLKISDTIGNAIKDKFFIRVQYNQPKRNYIYKIRFTYNQSFQSLPDILYTFMSMILEYFGDTNRDHLIVHEVIPFTNTKTMELYYYNTSFQVEKCDRQAEIYANQKIFDGVQPNTAFENYLSPRFEILEIQSKRNGSCTANKVPTASLSMFRNNEMQGVVNIQWGRYYIVQVPESLFRDEEDGNTRNLKLTFRYSESKNTELILDSFIYFDTTKQTGYIVPNDKMIEISKISHSLYYILTAYDKELASTSIEYIFKTSFQSTQSFYHISFYFNIFNIINQAHAVQLTTILSHLEAILGKEYENEICVKSYIIITRNGNNGQSELKWTPCSFSSSKCDYNKINDLRSKFFIKGTTTVTSYMKQKLTDFQITNIVDEGFEQCELNPPQIKKPIPPLSVSFCGITEYTIPAESFYDKDQGYTRNLLLTLKTPFSKPLPHWIHFDTNLQKITILPTRQQYINKYPLAYIFILEATDETLLKTSQALTVTFIDKPQDVDVKISLQARVSMPLNSIHPFMLIAKKVGSYFNDNGKGFEAISQTLLSSGLSLFEFGNCTISYAPCRISEQNNYRDQFRNNDGMFKQSFRDIFLPEFSSITLGDRFMGPCISSDTPPKLVRPIGSLYVTITKSFMFYIPENTFYDSEDGNTRQLRLELRDKNDVTLTSNFWVSLHSNQQSINIIATKDIATKSSKTTIKLIAYDKKLQSASQMVDIIINYEIRAPSHYFAMDFIVRSIISKRYIDVYTRLRTNIKQHFNDYRDTVSYEVVGNDFLNSVTVKWSNSTISTISCENDKIANMLSKVFSGNAIIATSFRNSLSSFLIQSLKFHYNGVCESRELAPTVSYPISALKASFCSSLIFKIPVNTFRDAVDGNTRNLNLHMTTEYGASIQSVKYIHFDSITQTLTVLPFDKAFSNTVFPKRFTFLLKAVNSRGLSVSTPLFVEITDNPDQYSFYYKVSAKWLSYKQIPTELEIAYKMQSKTNIYFNDPYNKFRVIDVKKSSVDHFSIDLTSCKLTYEPCDNININLILSKILNMNKDSYNINYALTFLPHINVYGVSAYKVGPCKSSIVNPPRQYLPLPSITLNMCSAFNYRLNPKTFIDSNGNHDLMHTIIKVNGMSNDYKTTWIATTTNKDVVATVNNDVISRSKSYILTLRVMDQNQMFIDAPWNIYVKGNIAQANYKITLYLTSKSLIGAYFVEKYHISNILNTFYKGNVTNIIDMKVSQSKYIQFTFSSCSLPMYCDASAASEFLSKMKVNNYIMPLFQNAFNYRYMITNIVMTTSSSCQSYNSAPIASMNELQLNSAQCDGLQFLIPSTLFYDKEDGNTRRLKLSLTHNDNANLPSWIYFHMSTQIVYVHPSRAEALSFENKPLRLKLTAMDKSGLSAHVMIVININIPTEPKYKFMFQYNVASTVNNRVQDTIKFKQKLSNYLRKPLSSINLLSYSVMSLIKREFVYSECFQSSQPCDKTAVNILRNKFIDSSNNYPSYQFAAAMLPEFLIQSAASIIDESCSNDLTAPILLSELAILKIPSCGLFTYQIPRNCFYDKQDGDTRNLQLDLVTSSGQPFATSSSWISFNKNTQTIYAIPISEIQKQNPTGFTYILSATDTTGLTTKANMKIELDIPVYQAQQCQIRTDFTSFGYNTNLVEKLNFILMKLQQYFQLEYSSDIAIVNFISLSQSKFQLYWSYCGRKTLTNQKYDQLNKIVNKLFLSDRKTMNPLFLLAFGYQYTITHSELKFSPQCTHVPPTPNNGPYTKSNAVIYKYAKSCEPLQFIIPNDLFRHPTQGDIRNMDISLTYLNGEKISNLEWVQINSMDRNNKFVYGVVTNTVIENSRPTGYEYLIKCTDNMGRFATIKIVINIIDTQPRIADHSLVMFIENKIPEPTTNAYLLYEYTKLLSSYLNPNSVTTQVFFHDFDFRSYVHFSMCTSVCNRQQWNNIVNKLKFQSLIIDSSNGTPLLEGKIKVKSVIASPPKCLVNQCL